MIKYIKGDLFKHISSFNRIIYIPHVCNDLGKMGKGFAFVLSQNFPEVKKRYLHWFKVKNLPEEGEFELGKTQFVLIKNQSSIICCNMIAQHGLISVDNPRPLRYNALAKCMDQIANYFLWYNEIEIHCPKFGSQLAGGNWNFVENLIEDC